MVIGKTLLKRYQWMRNSEGGQLFGNRMEIRLLDEEAFQIYIVPRLRKGFADSLAEYHSKRPDQTHYSVIWLDSEPGWTFVGVGSLEELEPSDNMSEWVIEVDDFESPQATEFGSRSDIDE